MAEYFIVNDVDKPDARHVTELVGEELRYIHPELRNWHPMSKDWATNVKDFGFAIGEVGDQVRFVKVRESTALYRDGSLRQWQGANEFVLGRWK